MKTYNVQQISEALDVNPETVRRWIRSRKLKASQESKKEGNVIQEDDLRRFLETYPKYASAIASATTASMGLMGPVGVGTALASSALSAAVISLVLSDKSRKAVLDESYLSEAELVEILKEGAESYRESASSKSNEAVQIAQRIVQLNKEADEDEKNAGVLEGVVEQLETEAVPEDATGKGE